MIGVLNPAHEIFTPKYKPPKKAIVNDRFSVTFNDANCFFSS